MRRIVSLLAVMVVAAVAGTLLASSPAMADFFGPFKNLGSGMCIQPSGDSSASGTAIVQEPCNVDATGRGNDRFQQWSSVCLNSSCSVFHYVNVGANLCMRARGVGGPANGEQIMLWACNTISDLNWASPSVDIPGHADYLGEYLQSRISGSTGYCLDVPGASTAAGTALQLWGCNGTVAQIYYFQNMFT